MPPTSTAVAAVWRLVATLITLFSGPTMVGVKVTVTEQEAPAASGDEETQLSASEKSPPVPTLTILTGEVAVFVTVASSPHHHALPLELLPPARNATACCLAW